MGIQILKGRDGSEINAFNDELLRASLANVVIVEETWLHINTPSDFQEAESVLLDARQIHLIC